MKSATIVLCAWVLVLLTACNQVDFRKTPGGVPYKVFSSEKGDSIQLGNVVKFEVIQKIKDSILFSSYKENFPQYLKVETLPAPARYMDIRSTIMELLPKLKSGDSLYLVQATDSLLKQDPNFTLKKGEQIVTTIRIEKVFKTTAEADEEISKAREAKMKENIAKAEEQDKKDLEEFKKDTAKQAQLQKDSKTIEEYLASHNIQAQKTDWGVYYQVLDPGQGPKPTIGKFANIKYKGTHFSGEVFDQGEFPLQIGTGGVIKGFEEGIKQIGQGGKARIFIPSVLAYGSRGSEPKIKPNEDIIFDIELLEVSDKPIEPHANIDTTQAH